MPNFRYKAVGISGRIETGSIEASSRLNAISDLQAKGFLPIETAEAPARSVSRLGFSKARRTATVPPRQLGRALQELAVLLQAGLALDRALELLAGETASPRLKPALEGVLANVRRGAALADAMGAYPVLFPATITTLIEAGEAGGNLEVSLVRAAEMLLRGAALRETLTSAMLYPMMLLLVAGVSLTIILTVVIPQFKPLFEDAGARLPLPTQIVMAIGDFVGAYWLLGLLLAIVATVAARHALRNSANRIWLDRGLLTVPFAGPLITRIEVARFARTLGTLVDNGIPLPLALGITHRGFRNMAWAQAIEQVGTSLKEGEGLAAPLEQTRLFPQIALHLIKVGEETARLGDMLARLGEILEQDVERLIQRALAVLVPLVTIGLGVLIAGIIASILVAVLSLNDLAILK
jgi:general secretion pathway protein F